MSEVMPETDTGSIFIAGMLVVQRTTSCCIVAERGVGTAMLSPAIKHCVYDTLVCAVLIVSLSKYCHSAGNAGMSLQGVLFCHSVLKQLL
jgi:hypothetical protein